jgi:LysM repeat protein
MEYTVADKQLELRLQLVAKTTSTVTEHVSVITDIQADESAPHPCTKGMESCKVKILFANAGESVWEIAKREHVSPTAVCAENDLDGDVIHERTALLIPLC